MAKESDKSRLFIVCGRERRRDELRELFGACGQIQSLQLALDRNGKSRGFAFLQYEDAASAQAAILQYDHKQLPDGHILKVTIAKEKSTARKGKLKRHQQQSKRTEHAQEDTQAPGKRQRSLPPSSPSYQWPRPRLPPSCQSGEELQTTIPTRLAALRVSSPFPNHCEVAKVLQDVVSAVSTSPDHPFSTYRNLSQHDAPSKRSMEKKRSMESPVHSRPDGRGKTEPVKRVRKSNRGQTEETLDIRTTLSVQPSAPPSSLPKKSNHKRQASTETNAGRIAKPRTDYTSACVKAETNKLFFSSSLPFTRQEIEAIFAAYEDLEHVQMVESFGRLQTMAYISYRSHTKAQSVVECFRHEAQRAEARGEFMRLNLAEEDNDIVMRSPTSPLIEASDKKKWLLVLYDRSVSNSTLSSYVSSLSGMEFIDLKVDTPGQGVAFVKFDHESSAVEASRQLHHKELPSQSGHYVQAIVIEDPSVFSSFHSAERPRAYSEDTELGAVEARFAHMMRTSDSFGYEVPLPYPVPSAMYHPNSDMYMDPYYCMPYYPPAIAMETEHTPPPPLPIVDVSSDQEVSWGALTSAIQECAGVIGMTKVSETLYRVEFSGLKEANDAVDILQDQSCEQSVLQAALKGSNKVTKEPSRRKRQRVDMRHPN